MKQLSRLQKLIATTIVILLVFLIVFLFKEAANKPFAEPMATPTSLPVSVSPNDPPQIVSTKPDLSNDTIISAAEVIEITFNRPLENVGEFKSRIEPKIDYKVELSGDRKTAKIIPAKPYDLGTTYTLYIGPDSKFDGVGEWRQDKTLRFRTVTYRGV